MTISTTRRLGGALMALALGVTLAGGAWAAPITFEFKGEVTDSDFAAIPVGSAVTGSYTFDDGLVDTDPDEFIGRYGPVDLEIHFVGGSSVVTSTAAFFINNNSSGIGTVDEYVVRMDLAPDMLTGSFAGLEWDSSRLYRNDDTGVAFPDDSLPLTPPDLASMPLDQSSVVVGGPGLEQVVRFTLTSLTLATPDNDGDGIADDLDNCPKVANADQSDIDLDEVGDACDPDIDGDGALNEADNCPRDPNPDQADADGDGAGDVCDADLDNDGVQDSADRCVPTAPGEVVDGEGCSIAQICPCDRPWKHRAAYLVCIAKTANDFRKDGLISVRELLETVLQAGKSQCGKRK